jgi:hypothetical protein
MSGPVVNHSIVSSRAARPVRGSGHHSSLVMPTFEPALESSRLGRSSELRTAPAYTPESRAREFTDNDGVRWTVREIVPEVRSVTHRTLLTRPGYENGWLSFRSEAMSCRIAPYPANWRLISEYELERWCMKAQHAARVRKGR